MLKNEYLLVHQSHGNVELGQILVVILTGDRHIFTYTRNILMKLLN